MQLPPLHEIMSRIDHAVLKPWQGLSDLRRAISEAQELRLRGIIVSPPLLPHLVDEYTEGVRGVVVGFPYGYTPLEAKIKELEQTLASNPDEVDAVINYQRLLLGDVNYVRNEAAAIVELCHEVGVRVKLIIEAPALTREILREAVRIAVEAGADYIKTSTGVAPRKTLPEDVVLIKRTLTSLNPRRAVGIKAAGGIRSALQALALLRLGATIIGTSTPRSIAETYAALAED